MVASNVDLSVIRELPASIMVLDRDLRFVTASEMYLQTTGRKLDDLVGRYLFDAFPESEARRKPLRGKTQAPASPPHRLKAVADADAGSSRQEAPRATSPCTPTCGNAPLVRRRFPRQRSLG